MNDYFVTIGQELADEIDQSPSPLLVGDYMINKGNKTLKFTKIFKQHIRDVIDKAKTSKGFGNDNLETTISPVTFLNLLCLISSKHWRACLASPWRKGSSLLFGKLLELFLLSEKEIKMPKKIVGQHLSFQSFQGPLKD